MTDKELEEAEPPIGDFIFQQTDIKPITGTMGSYYHYGDVCALINRAKEYWQSQLSKTGGEIPSQGEIHSTLLVNALRLLSPENQYFRRFQISGSHTKI